MPEGLIIVESPAKARTLKRFLGDRFDVRASMGHVRDLPEKEMGVEVDDGFKPHYEVVESRRKTINELRSAAKGEPEIILASDPDREGEAIAWHLAHALNLEPERDVVDHPAMREQPEVLEHHGDGMTSKIPELGGPRGGDVGPGDLDAAGGRLDQPDQCAHERRLPGPREPHDDEDLAGVHLDRDVAHGDDAAGLLAKLPAR